MHNYLSSPNNLLIPWVICVLDGSCKTAMYFWGDTEKLLLKHCTSGPSEMLRNFSFVLQYFIWELRATFPTVIKVKPGAEFTFPSSFFGSLYIGLGFTSYESFKKFSRYWVEKVCELQWKSPYTTRYIFNVIFKMKQHVNVKKWILYLQNLPATKLLK